MNPRSCGPGRTGSKSGLDDATDSGDTSCMSGMVAGDWRVRVAPHMWNGWQMPGSDLTDLDKLKERIESMHFLVINPFVFAKVLQTPCLLSM